MEPVVVALNHALSQASFDFVGMIGISGGGWTTVLSAALDPRIDLSVSVAGSIPLSMRTSEADVGDWEQFEPGLYRLAGYPDLYLLGASGAGRRALQVHGEHDPDRDEDDPDRHPDPAGGDDVETRPSTVTTPVRSCRSEPPGDLARQPGHLLDEHALSPRQVDHQGVCFLRLDTPKCQPGRHGHQQKKGEEQQSHAPLDSCYLHWAGPSPASYFHLRARD